MKMVKCLSSLIRKLYKKDKQFNLHSFVDFDKEDEDRLKEEDELSDYVNR